MSSSEEKTSTISPDQGATGETTTSSENKEARMQTGLSEEEKDAQYKEEYNKAERELWEHLKGQNPELCWNIIIESLFKQFARENRAKRSKEGSFFET